MHVWTFVTRGIHNSLHSTSLAFMATQVDDFDFDEEAADTPAAPFWGRLIPVVAGNSSVLDLTEDEHTVGRVPQLRATGKAPPCCRASTSTTCSAFILRAGRLSSSAA